MKKIIIGLLLALLFTTEEINHAKADSPSHIIINEIQVAGKNSNTEFIELFNPTDIPIDLKEYKLTKKTKTVNSESILVSTAKFSGIIQAYGYFLIAHPDYQDQISADLAYSGSTYYLSNDNTVLLYDANNTLLDKVGFGAASDFETISAPNPGINQSIERINFIDTDNNAADFSINTFPSPQNKSITENNDKESLDGNESLENTEGDNNNNSDASDLCTAVSLDVKLNEIFPYPEKGDEFIEVTNIGEKCADISGWKIMDEAGHKKEFPKNSIIYPGEYLILEGNLYLNNDSDTVYLLGKNGDLKTDALDSRSFKKAQKNSSFIFDTENWLWTSTPTPGQKNVITAPDSDKTNSGNRNNNDATENISSSEGIYLNEIFPNPKKNLEEEYIEIANGESGPIDLYGWQLKDISKNRGYKFKEHIIIEPGEYLAIYKSQSKISLNNSNESVYLYNPEGNIVSSASYEQSQKDASYNFNGESWCWSKYLTPGEKNKFDSKPSVKIKKIKHAYKNIYTKFFAKAKDKETKKLKYIWDFGDGKKSYLAKTSHKYLDIGKYTVTLSVSDDSQTIEKSFTLTVKNYPQPDLEIIKIVPNPVGNDSNSETIDLKNNSGKKINLDGWKIATGSVEKLYNHPISNGIILNPGETKVITREMSRFILNNKSGKVQLVSPDEKTADEVEYEKEKITEDEAYIKINGKWQWIKSEIKNENTSNNETKKEENAEKDNSGKILGAADENISVPVRYPRFFFEDAYTFFSQIISSQSPTESNCRSVNNPLLSFAYLLALTFYNRT